MLEINTETVKGKYLHYVLLLISYKISGLIKKQINKSYNWDYKYIIWFELRETLLSPQKNSMSDSFVHAGSLKHNKSDWNICTCIHLYENIAFPCWNVISQILAGMRFSVKVKEEHKI